MRVAVIGAGGIGGLYGAVLARAGHEVCLLARGQHLAAIQARGLKVQSAEFGEFTIADTRASVKPADLGQAELILFTVKTYDLEEALPAAQAMLAPNGALITFQNGLDAPDRLAEVLGEGRVLIGTTRVEATVLEPGVIGHLSPFHVVTVGEFSGTPTLRVTRVVDAFKAAGINAHASPDGHRALWEKASMLIPMATITAVCRASFGPIRDLPETRELARGLFAEFNAVAAACGYDLETASGPTGLNFDTAPATMTTSMARDFERGNRTELEALTGTLVCLADKHGVPVPTTRAAYAILKLRASQSASAGTAESVLGTAAARR